MAVIFPSRDAIRLGVKRQDCGELGKRANCQAGVCVGYVSSQGYTLLDRRRICLENGSPTTHMRLGAGGAAFRQRLCSKPSQSWPRRCSLRWCNPRACGVGAWVVADEAFGCDPDFLDGVARLGLWYVAEVPHTTRVWYVRPATHVPMWRGRGRQPHRLRLAAGAPDARPVQEVATALPPGAWSRQTIKEGSQGPMVAEFAACRVIAVRDALPGPDVWLVLRRHLETGELKTYLCNAPADTPLATQVRLSGMRWPIETCFEDGKQLLGMGDYEVRSWAGWHHHLTLVILAHFFVVRMHLRLKKSARSHATSGSAAVNCSPAPARV